MIEVLKVLVKLLVIVITIAVVGLLLSGLFGYLSWGSIFTWLFKGFWVLAGLALIWVVTVMMNVTGRDRDA